MRAAEDNTMPLKPLFVISYVFAFVSGSVAGLLVGKMLWG
jgi:hypothetical protein